MGNDLPTVVDPTIPVTVLPLTSCTPRMVLRCGSRRPVCLLADVLEGQVTRAEESQGASVLGIPPTTSLPFLHLPWMDGVRAAGIKLGIRVVSSSAHLAGCVV